MRETTIETYPILSRYDRAVTGVGVAWFCLSAPALLFPNLIASQARTAVITLLAVGAVSIATYALRSHRDVAPWVLALATTLCVSWIVHGVYDSNAASHFGGACLGVLAMALVARLGTSHRWLWLLFALISVAGAAVLVAGVMSISLSSVRTLKFGAAGDWIWWRLYHLPDVALPFPGLLPGGKVNANALGGTAAALLPLSVGLAMIWRSQELARLRWLLSGLGLLATGVGLTALVVTLSRSGLATVALTAALACWFWRPLRRPLLAVAVVAVALVLWDFAKTPEGRPHPLAHAAESLGARGTVWAMGWEALRESPVLGIGINQFHPLTPHQPQPSEQRVAHAHNVFLQVALDLGVVGLLAYVGLLWAILRRAVRQVPLPPLRATVSAAAGLSIVAIHLFGLGDAITLGAKVGLIQWWCAGLILAAGVSPAQVVGADAAPR